MKRAREVIDLSSETEDEVDDTLQSIPGHNTIDALVERYGLQLEPLRGVHVASIVDALRVRHGMKPYLIYRWVSDSEAAAMRSSTRAMFKVPEEGHDVLNVTLNPNQKVLYTWSTKAMDGGRYRSSQQPNLAVYVLGWSDKKRNKHLAKGDPSKAGILVVKDEGAEYLRAIAVSKPTKPKPKPKDVVDLTMDEGSGSGTSGVPAVGGFTPYANAQLIPLANRIG